MTKSTKATLELLLARKEQALQNKLEYKEVEVKTLGLTFTVQRLPLTRVISILDKYKDESSLMSDLESNKEVIYNSVPIFQSEKLQAAYDLAEPFDIVPAVLEDNIMAISELAQGIIEIYGLGGVNPIEQIKN